MADSLAIDEKRRRFADASTTVARAGYGRHRGWYERRSRSGCGVAGTLLPWWRGEAPPSPPVTKE
ncbi:hypothetical protein QWM81_20110 [Streptomyces ficellus]|uniref:Uncharacterized protein n=1 Tax=Streptomyces ficellus TaxID=1977088 RepID=A0ABT7Z9Z1_9ACTN|nr:hypothetical protein [Streptomyces ficellus]MDN3296327.1 hypothetical protein [Streptomyces ficellus]